MNLQAMLPARVVGVDVQQDAIRLVKVYRHGKKREIEQMASIAMPASVFNQDRIEDWQQLHEVVSELVITAEVRKASAVVCLPAALVEMGTMTLPSRLSSAENLQAIATHLGGNKIWQIDYATKPGATKNEAHFIYVATPRAYLMQYVSCLESGGLKVKHVDIDTHALKRLTHYHVENTHVVILVLPEVAMLAYWRGHELLAQQTWDACEWQYDAGVFLKKLQTTLHESGYHIDAVSLYLPDEWKLLFEHAIWDWPVLLNQPFAEMTIAPALMQMFASVEKSYFSIATGLAMYGWHNDV